MSGPIAAGAFRAALEDHAREQLDEADSSPASSRQTAPSGPARYGARALDSTSRAAMDRVQVERLVVRPWAGSAEYAIRAWVAVMDEGASLRSTCDPDRANRVQTSADPSLGGREHDRIERVATVARAIRDASMRALVISEACPLVTPTQGMHLALLAIGGRGLTRSTGALGHERKGTYWTRQQMIALDVAIWAREEWGLDVREYHVRALAAHLVSTVREALSASGELRGSASGELRGSADGPRRGRRRGFEADPAARVRARMAAG